MTWNLQKVELNKQRFEQSLYVNKFPFNSKQSCLLIRQALKQSRFLWAGRKLRSRIQWNIFQESEVRNQASYVWRVKRWFF